MFAPLRLSVTGGHPRTRVDRSRKRSSLSGLELPSGTMLQWDPELCSAVELQ